MEMFNVGRAIDMVKMIQSIQAHPLPIQVCLLLITCFHEIHFHLKRVLKKRLTIFV